MISRSLSLRELFDELSAQPDWRLLHIRHGKLGSWVRVTDLDGRLSIQTNRRYWLTAAAVVALALISGAAIAVPAFMSSSAELTAMIDPASRKRSDLADKLLEGQRDLPKKIDRHTIRTGANFQDPVLLFSNIALLDRRSLTDKAKAEAARAVRANSCGLPPARQFMQAGGTLSFSYADTDAQPLMAISVSEKDCP